MYEVFFNFIVTLNMMIFRYDAISKMETFSEDTQFILQQAGLEEKLSVEWKHRTGASPSYLCLKYF